MATSISTVYDAILTELGTIFPNKLRIPNAYTIIRNPVQFLRDAYGLRVDAAVEAKRDFCNFSRIRDFTVILSREVLKTDVQTDQMDTAVKAMLEDVYTLQKNFLDGEQIGAATDIDIINVGAFTGIEEFIFEKTNFINTEVAFSIQVSNVY